MNAYFKSLLGVLAFASAVATLPLMAAFAGLQPPWPSGIEYVSAVFIVMAALVMWEWARAAKRTTRRRLIAVGLLLTLVGIGAYLPLESMFVTKVPESGERLVRGGECTPDAKLLYGDACPDLLDGTLADVEWEPEKLWTRSSILYARMKLVGAWLCFMAGLIAFVGAVVAGRQDRSAGKPAEPGKG